jgi:Sulfotransferase family
LVTTEKERTPTMEQRAENFRSTMKETTESHGRKPCLFIVGCARSGTTLLHRIVDAHPLVAITPEIHWITHHFKQKNSPTTEEVVTPELLRKLVEHKRFAEFELDHDKVEALATEIPVSYRVLLEGLFGLYGEGRDKPLVGNKTPAFIRRIPVLHDLWPEARFVHIIRDGRDVCLSVMNWRKAGSTAGRYPTYDDDPVTTTALWWERKVRQGRVAGRLLGPDLYREVHYEDLVSDPEGECRELCRFLGVPYDDAMLRFHVGKTRYDLPNPRRQPKKAWLPITAGLRKWRSDMPPLDVERFEAAVAGLLDELGYERAFPDPSPESMEHAERIQEALPSDLVERSDRPRARW